jgi:hypothetical protein
MKSRLPAVLLLAGSSLFFGTVPGSAAVVPGPPPPVRIQPVPVPRPGFTWVPGYYHPLGSRWAWHGGYWARAPYPHARWVAPRYYGGRYHRGYWRR